MTFYKRLHSKYISAVAACWLSCSLMAQDTARLTRFIPSSFSNSFTAGRQPVLRIRSGDTVRTETIDAFGRDRNGIRRQGGGNPLTGPFYIENALPGDVLVVTLNDVSLNRPYAYTSESFTSRSMPDSITEQFGKKTAIVRWKLDLHNKIGWPDSISDTYDHLKNFKVPLQPFLGCIGVAPANKKNEILSFFQGPFGGNLDYNRTTTGTTIYLPVFHPGALLYIGDGHAAQGDGEIAGNALETSMDVEFTVKIIKKDILQLTYPRLEDSLYIITLGSAKDLGAALKIASSGLLSWLQKEFRLTLHEATQVMSTTIEYTIVEIADPEVVVAAKIRKELLKNLKAF